jgi:prevent-host-death family protein
MERIGVRELRDGLSGVLRRVASGETVEVTDHGHPVARIVPLRHRTRYEQMVAEGKIIPAEEPGNLLDFEPPPLQPGERPLSEILADLRADER